MSYLASSPITLNAVPLQVNEGGFSVSGISQVDEGESWLSREKLASLRDANDALGFDMVTLTGARVRVDYVGTGHTVPANNEAALDTLYKKVLRRSISISGSTMNATDFAAFYNLYIAAQQYWIKRTQLIAQLGDSDITYDKVLALATSYGALVKPVIPLVSPLISDNVSFAEGASCSFTSYIDNIVTDFNFELVLDIALA